MQRIKLPDKEIPDLMNAVVLRRPSKLEFTTIPVWPIESYEDPDLILVEVKACGVCGSDFRYFQGENPWAQHTAGKHVENPPNIVLGHEYAGEVVTILSNHNDSWLGKRVVPICSKVCGVCEMCRTGRAHLCENTIHLGHGQGWGSQQFYPGAYADYAPAWARGCYEIPTNLSFEEAAMMDVLAVCAHAYQRAAHRENFPLLILGGGPIGNGIGQVAANQGVDSAEIIVVENSPVALEVAGKTGFSQVIDSASLEEAGIEKEILELTGGRKVLSVFDSIGTDQSFQIGMDLLDKGGNFINLAVHDQAMKTFNQMQLSSERTITTSSNFSIAAYERAWKWLCEGKFKIAPWLTRVSLKEIPRIFKETIKNKKEREYFKLIITEE
jgi:threonine dehydrogenase-like Zn-dependent dehydrogenase